MNTQYQQPSVEAATDMDELCDLDVTIARFILPRLVSFKQHCERTPTLEMTHEEWNTILDKMIFAFDRIAHQTEEDTPEYQAYIKAIWNNEEDLVQLKHDAQASLKPIAEGMDLFHRYFRSLWW